MITFNNIVERFEDFATSHFFIKSFSFGSPDDVDLAKFTEFPLMHLVYTGATYDSGTKTYNIEVYILDVPADKTDKVERQREVVSDAEQCAEDIIADIRMGGNIFTFAQDYEVVNATTTPLEEETKNVLSGVLLDLSVAIPYEWDACNAPIDGVTPGGGDEPSYARRGFLRMLTLDGSTDVLSVRTIKVNNGTLSDDGDGVVTLDTGGVDTLAALTDVTISNLENHDVLKYNSGLTRWENVDWLLILYAELKQGTSTVQNNGNRTDSALELTVTQAKLKTGITGVEITETSPGDIDLIVATDASGSTAYTAINIDGSTTASEADINLYGNVYIHDEANSTKALLTHSSTFNTTLALPTKGGTLARIEDIPNVPVDSVNGQTGVVVLVTTDIDEGTNLYYTDARVAANSAVAANTAKVGITTQQASDITANNAKVGITPTQASEITANTAKVGITSQQAADITANNAKTGITTQQASDITTNNDKVGVIAGGTAGQALVKASGTDYDLEWADAAIDTQYHNRFQTDAETFRSGATDTVELYYTAKADGDGLAESASSDTPTAGKIIKRKIYYSEAAFADPDTGTWVEFTPAPADDASFATVKAALLEYLKARTGGTVPISLKQSWEEVDAAPAFTGLLNETYGSGAEAAYSTRRLNGNVTDCMVIRRASDSTTTTIGFDGSGNISEADIISFCTGTTCTVQTWKDQSGNGNDAEQSTPANEPIIYQSGSIEKLNGRAVVNFNGDALWGGYLSNEIQTLFIAFKPAASGSRWLYDFDTGGAAQIKESGASGFTDYVDGNDYGGDFGSVDNLPRVLLRGESFDAQTTPMMKISDRNAGDTTSNPGQQKAHEIIAFNAVKSGADVTSIEENIGDYFTQNTPLLDTYTGAAAAYSLRKLRTAYTGSAVEVYNGSSYADIGFNVFGELNTVALADHCGSNDGFVSKWYCQSGNSNDAVQTNTALMPKIYDGTTATVVTENGKPAIEFDGATNYLDRSVSIASDYPFSLIDVATPDTLHQGTVSAMVNTGSTMIMFANLYNIPDNENQIWTRNGTLYKDGPVVTTGQQDLNFLYWSSDTVRAIHVNGGTAYSPAGTTNFPTVNNLSIGMLRDQTPNAHFDGKIQEVVWYASDESDNRTGIETNIATFYDITI